MINIGSSIIDAIDWTQDRLRSTRPLAETVLFSLLADRKVTETEAGYVLLEDNEEEFDQRRHRRRRSRFRFHHKRKTAKSVQHEGVSEEAEDMLYPQTPDDADALL